MARELRTEIEIRAPARRVWDVLTNFTSYPEWNPFMPQATGDIEVGSRLEVRLEPEGARGMTIKPTVTKVDAGREYRWLGHLGVPGVFDGEHCFVIEELDGERVRLRHFERFTGALAPLVLRMVGEPTRRGFEAMNAALKERVEDA